MPRQPRKPTPKPETTTPAVPDTSQALAVVADEHAQAQADRDRANRIHGRLQYANGIKELVTVTTLLDYQFLKTSGSYKHLQIEHEGKLVTVTSWGQYCELAVGVSREKMDLDLKNLEAFGADALEGMQRIGLGHREMRKIRKIPEESRETVLAEIEKEDADKTVVAAIIDEIYQSREDEKQRLERAMADQQKEHAAALEKAASEANDIKKRLAAKEKIVGEKEAKIQELQENLHTHESAGPEEREQLALAEINGLATAILSGQGQADYGQRATLAGLRNALARIWTLDPSQETRRAAASQVEQMIGALQGIVAEFYLTDELDSLGTAAAPWLDGADLADGPMDGETMQ